jgi:hypothetical protein
MAPGVSLVTVPRMQKLGFDFAGEVFAINLLSEGRGSEEY